MPTNSRYFSHRTTVSVPALLILWRRWWRRQSPARQDRFITFGPLFAVVLFLAAVIAAFSYLRIEESAREQQAVRRDVEYAQQRLRLRLLEGQEQLMRLAREVSNQELNPQQFIVQAESLVNQYPELMAVSWVDTKQRIKVAYISPSAHASHMHAAGDYLKAGEAVSSYELAHDLREPVYAGPFAAKDSNTAPPTLQLQIPLDEQGKFHGVIMSEYSVDGLMRFGVPTEVTAKYAVTLVDDKNTVLAGSLLPKRNRAAQLLPWSSATAEYEIPVSPVGNGLLIRAEGYRTAQGVVGSGFFWLVSALSSLTVWMLLGTWRHTRRRVQAQEALITETNFRRAMENSMLTGMRALDLQGRISYVNPAFCQMTGFAENELVGQTAPFPHWPEAEFDLQMARLDDELNGRTPPGGFEIRVKRKNGQLFDARMYASPLIEPNGQQKGWMTSMTDITEPKRIREELSASYERFTTVLQGLDAAVSVAPLGSSQELLFASKLYRAWFGADVLGHLNLIAQAGLPTAARNYDSLDTVDGLAGLPTDTLTTAQTENAEIFVPELMKWLEVRSRYLTWVDGRLAQMVIATDITPRRQAEEQAALQKERAQTASRLITMGEMASSVAHELNQPLTAINNYCNGMVSRIKGQQISNEDLLVALEKTAKQAHRAGQIIQRIRSFVKRSEPNRSQVEVTTIVSNAMELAEIELKRHHVRLNHYIAARLPDIMVDPILIEQVLINLMKNAAESIAQAHLPAARRKVELRVAPKRMENQDMVEFSVLDSGHGLSTEVTARLYEAFYSTKAEGMGIGLKLCRSIVESHQGRMQAENLYNGSEVSGCRFTFWIPVAPLSSQVMPAAPLAAAKDIDISLDPLP